MKLWIKIVWGAQLLFILFFIIFARIRAAEAKKQTVLAQEQAMQAMQEAEKQAELAAQAMAMAHAAEQEARSQAELARAQLEECISKK